MQALSRQVYPVARLIVINDVGHLMYLEKPTEFSRIVIDFLEKQ